MVTCVAGYDGGGTATCNTDGQFNTLACTANTCTQYSVANSNKAIAKSITGTTGQTVTVTCNTGYSGSGIATCGTNGQFNTLSCTANICTCPNGSPTIASGTGASLCDIPTIDCSACDAGYTISTAAASGSAQTCNAISCSTTQVTNSDMATKNSIAGKLNIDIAGMTAHRKTYELFFNILFFFFVL